MSAIPDLPGFTDVAEIGAGAYGTVYRAWQQDFDRTVAIKVLHGVHASEESLERFARERRVLGGLSTHPHIVTVYAGGISAANQPYIVMSFLEGGAWGDGLGSGGAMPWASVLSGGIKLCGALATAHDAGVLHRDIKPDNVLIDEFGEPQLADFGVARMQGGQTLTAEGSAIGTLNYMAPEAIDGQVTVATDVYSLAATLHHAMLGRAAFARDELMASIIAIVNDDLPSLGEQGVPAVVEAAVVAGMARDHEVRPPDAASFGRALQAAQAAVGLAVTPMMIRGVAPLPAGVPSGAVASSGPTMTGMAVQAPDESALLQRIRAGSPDRSSAALTVSRIRAVRGDVDGAVDVLRQVLATTDHDVDAEGEPGKGQVRAALARLAARTGRQAVAAEALAVDEDHPDMAAVMIALADLDRRAGQTDRAIAAFQPLADHEDGQVSGWARLGLAHCLRHRDPGGAVGHCADVAQDERVPVEARAAAEVARARLLGELGRMSESTAALQEMVGQPGHPRRVEALAMLTADLVAAGDIAGAARRVRDMQTHQGDPLAAPWIAYSSALMAAATGDRATAIERVGAVLASWHSAAGSALLGPAAEVLIAVGADDRAAEVLEAALARRVPGQQAEVAVILGDLARRRGDRLVALTHYQAAGAFAEPGFSARAVVSQAELEIEEGDHAAAGVLLDRVASGDDRAHALQARLLQGLSLLDQGRWGRGRAALEEVAGSGHARQAIDALLWLIRLHTVQGDQGAAAAAMAQAEAQARQDPVVMVEVLRASADAHLRSGRLDEAIAKLQEAGRLAGPLTRDEIAVQHAAALFDSGQDQAAAVRLRGALAEAQNSVAVGKAELLLAQLELRSGARAEGSERLHRLAEADTPVAAAANATIVLTGLSTPDQ